MLPFKEHPRRKLLEKFLIFFFSFFVQDKACFSLIFYIPMILQISLFFFSQGVVILATFFYMNRCSWLKAKKIASTVKGKLLRCFLNVTLKEDKKLYDLFMLFSTARKSFHFARIFFSFFYAHQPPLSKHRHTMLYMYGKSCCIISTVDLFVSIKL